MEELKFENPDMTIELKFIPEEDGSLSVKTCIRTSADAPKREMLMLTKITLNQTLDEAIQSLTTSKN